MLKADMKYGAVKTKVLAMYSRALKDADYNKMCDLGSVTEITSYLRSHKGYSQLATQLPPQPTVEDYKKGVKKLDQNDFEKLYKFASIEDKKCLIFMMYRVDYECVLAVLRRLYSSSDENALFDISEFELKHCNVDIEQLAECVDYQGLLSAVQGSIFEESLSMLHIDQKTGLPDYTEASIAMESNLYKASFGYARKSYHGISAAKLSQVIGTEADVLNIMHILRIRRYFPSSLERFEELLIPVKKNLNSQLLYSMRAARSEDETIEILRKSRCSRYFKDFNSSNIDNLYEKVMGEFCRRLIRMPEPCIVVPVAYLMLREIESRRLIRLIEAVSYGVDPRKSL